MARGTAGVEEAAMQGDNDNHEPMFNLPRVIIVFILLLFGRGPARASNDRGQ